MLCRNPYTSGVHCFPCGQCMPCRFNRRRIWTHRLLLEQLQHSFHSFVTLTYDNKHLPQDGSLKPKEVQDWLKRFRKAIAPNKVRYYLVGEYGDASQRPHYHIALFGYPSCVFGRSRYSHWSDRCCCHCDLVRDTWGRGNIVLGSLTAASAQYVAGYVTKKLTKAGDPRLNGRHPEFARMSLRPGLGADAIHEVASVFLSLDLHKSQADVPVSLRHGSRLLPLGTYMRRKLREATYGTRKSSPEALEAFAKEVRPLWEAASAAAPGLANSQVRVAIFKDLLTGVDEQRVASLEARSKIFKQRRSV